VMKQALDFLKSNNDIALATVGLNGRPMIRAFQIMKADASASDIPVPRAGRCVPSGSLQMAAEKYLRPRPIEVAASGPEPSASASRHPVRIIFLATIANTRDNPLICRKQSFSNRYEQQNLPTLYKHNNHSHANLSCNKRILCFRFRE